ncbi:site-specific DNA-methyltransferase [Actinoallomurus sp. NBC_01490]|uniref:DNA methyltransferase n=1 Tax=Actinoallomurus sp. NBC_01490 TaxID=2903557 RepID=UPI002E33BFAA|nr:DNA methyltransferase [Actinoallomurus sp. NBC_01490]
MAFGGQQRVDALGTASALAVSRAHRGGNHPTHHHHPWPPDGNGTASNKQTNCRQRRRGRETGSSPQRHAAAPAAGRNPGDLWSISTRPFRQAHYAVLPVELPLRCNAAGCQPRGTDVDSFVGTATTRLAAQRIDRTFWGIELNPAYADLAAARLTHDNAFARQRRR